MLNDKQTRLYTNQYSNRTSKRYATLTKEYDALLLFIGLLLIGIILYRGYGMSTDEGLQRQHGLVLFKMLFPRFTEGLVTDTVDFTNVPLLKDYWARQYGVAIQFPCVLIEAIFRFNLPIRTVYYIRHLWTYFLWALSVCAFYGTIWEMFHGRIMALFGSAIYIVCPVIFASAFYNIKDTVFMALITINLYLWTQIKRHKGQYTTSIILYSITGALAVNLRIVAAIVLLFECITLVIPEAMEQNCSVSNRTSSFTNQIQLIAVITSVTLLFYYMFTPLLWGNPVTGIKDIYGTFSNYISWTGTNFFLGQYFPGTKTPWYYMILSTILTLPVIYTLCIFLGGMHGLWILGYRVFEGIKNRDVRSFQLNTKGTVCLSAGVIILFMHLYVIIKTPVLYCGWRHFYFLWPFYVILMVFFLDKSKVYIEKAGIVKSICNKYGEKKQYSNLESKSSRINICAVILLLSVMLTFAWMVVNHPFEYVYYNVFARKYVNDYFERDWWRVSSIYAMKEVSELKDDKSNLQHAIIYINDDMGYYLLDNETKNKVKLTENKDEARYWIETYAHISQEKSEEDAAAQGWVKIEDRFVGPIIIYTIYQRVEK